ncbi:hypothetical protein AB0G02_21280 [Actinosynnema sp. NPDC023658]|uniref:hypothetical protein n=1 Tax=Actinosynnema sp. NPDC023658 TaxID=3155465 RepID=UPI0033D21CCD
MTHPPTSLPILRGEKAERRVWALLSALFALVSGVNAILAVSEAAWWHAAVATLCLVVAVCCARVARRP